MVSFNVLHLSLHWVGLTTKSRTLNDGYNLLAEPVEECHDLLQDEFILQHCYVSLSSSENWALTLLLQRFAKYWVNTVKNIQICEDEHVTKRQSDIKNKRVRLLEQNQRLLSCKFHSASLHLSLQHQTLGSCTCDVLPAKPLSKMWHWNSHTFLRITVLVLIYIYIHCVQKKTPITHIFFHISMNYFWV